MKRLLYSGKIYKDGKEVGSYSFSLFNDTFSWEIEGCQPRHFYKEDELIKELTANGYRFDESYKTTAKGGKKR